MLPLFQFSPLALQTLHRFNYAPNIVLYLLRICYVFLFTAESCSLLGLRF